MKMYITCVIHHFVNQDWYLIILPQTWIKKKSKEKKHQYKAITIL